MLQANEVKRLGGDRLKDAEALFAASRYDGAAYLCGYSVELALKARICKTLKWVEFPETNKEFKDLKSLQVHNLDCLLRFTGREARVKKTMMAEWSAVSAWHPDSRYRPVGKVSKSEARLMLDSARTLFDKI